MSERSDPDSLHPDTLAVGLGYDPAKAFGAVKPPIVLSSTFAYPSAMAAKDLKSGESLLHTRPLHGGLHGLVYGPLASLGIAGFKHPDDLVADLAQALDAFR